MDNLHSVSSKQVLIVGKPSPRHTCLVNDMNSDGLPSLTASSASEAKVILEQNSIDLIISEADIEEMSGYHLLSQAKDLYPHLKRLLLTENCIDEEMCLIKNHNIENIIPIPQPFVSKEIIQAAKVLLSDDFFGVEKYLNPHATIEKVRILTPYQIEDACTTLSTLYGAKHNIDKLKVVLNELMTNAMFYGAKNECGATKEKWEKDFTLPESEAIEIFHGKDHEKVGISIIDKGGKLEAKTILYWLDRQITNGDKGFPKGLLDSHGRGIYISRKLADRLIINIEYRRKSECIILNYHEERDEHSKPIRIVEV